MSAAWFGDDPVAILLTVTLYSVIYTRTGNAHALADHCAILCHADHICVVPEYTGAEHASWGISSIPSAS